LISVEVAYGDDLQDVFAWQLERGGQFEQAFYEPLPRLRRGDQLTVAVTRGLEMEFREISGWEPKPD
jgi:hypothetical protein